MSDITYTDKELAAITLNTHFRLMALETAFLGVIQSLPKVITSLDELTPEKGEILANKLREEMPKLLMKYYLEFIADDKKISDVLRDDLKKSFGDIKFD